MDLAFLMKNMAIKELHIPNEKGLPWWTIWSFNLPIIIYEKGIVLWYGFTHVICKGSSSICEGNPVPRINVEVGLVKYCSLVLILSPCTMACHKILNSPRFTENFPQHAFETTLVVKIYSTEIKLSKQEYAHEIAPIVYCAHMSLRYMLFKPNLTPYPSNISA